MRYHHRRALVRVAALAILAALAITCRDLPFEPGMEMRGSLDVSGIMETAQDIPIPIDSLVVELRRTSDSSVVFSSAISVDSITISAAGDTVSVDITVELNETSEEFYLHLAVVGDGEVWFEVRDVVTASVGSEPTVAEISEPIYVGPGANATGVAISLSDTTITGGDSVLVTGTAYVGDSPVDGALVWFESSDPSLVPTPSQVGRNQAWVVVPPASTDSATITAVCPTGTGTITADGKLHFYARPNAINRVSGNNQEMPAGAVAPESLVVQVIDAAGDPFTRGYSVSFEVASGPSGTSVSPTSTSTDASGLASTALTAGDAIGAIQVNASASGLSGSPVAFSATVIPGAAATMVAYAGDEQTATVGTAVSTTPAVQISDENEDPVPDVEVTFTVLSGGGSVSGATATTDSEGIAAVGSWTLGTTAGANTLEASAEGLQSVVFSATGTAGAAASLNIYSGDGQTGAGATALPLPLVVIVADQHDNPVGDVDVDWSTSFGTVDPARSQTDAQGLAQTTWTLDADSIDQTATATVTALDPVTFTATLGSGAASITIVDGDSQTATVGTTVPVNPSVLVADGGGNPLADQQVTFAVESGGGSVTGAVVNTDVEGVAQVGGWTLGQTAGSNTLSATVAGLDPVTFTATGTADAADTVVIISGDGQTGEAGTELASPLVVEVRDQFANVVSGETVDWQALNGSVTPASSTTDASGQVEAVWVLGTNSATQTVSATVGTLPAAVFTATATFPTPAILLNLVGTDRISVGQSADLEVALSAPAAAGGVTVTVTSDNPSVVSVQTPGTVTIAEGSTTGQILLDGVAGGSTTIRGNATGYTEGTLIVESSLQVLSLSQTLNVPFGGTASLPISLSTAAPAGGETITLISTDPSIVSLQTSTLTIPEGSTNGSATVSGIAPGTTTITATSTNYGSAQSTVSTTANLNIEQTSLTINESFGGTITISLESGGSQIAAPSPGIEVTLTAADPTCVAATSPVTIPAGLVDVTSDVAYGGSATTTCSTTLTASAPDITSDAITVTVNPTPTISLSQVTVGGGLQDGVSAYLSASNHGGVDVVLTSSDPTSMLISPDAATPGTESLTISVSPGYSSFSYYVQGVEDAVATTTLTATATGFSDATAQIDIVQPAVSLYGLVSSSTSLSPNDAFQVRVGVPDADLTYMTEFQAVRAGAPAPLTATVTTSDEAVGQLTTTAVSGDTATVEIAQGSNRSPSTVSAGGIEFDPVGAGVTTVAASIPGYATLPIGYSSQEVTVTAPEQTLYAATVGSGLHRNNTGYLGASNHGGVDVVLTSSDPTVLLLAPNASTPGIESITISLADGYTSYNYYIQGVEDAVGSATITATATGFVEASVQDDVVQPTFRVYGLVTSTTSLSSNDQFQVRVGIPDASASYISEYQAVRAGAPASYTATLTTSDGAVGQLRTTAITGDTVTVDIAEGAYSSPSTVDAGGVEFVPTGAGVATISASIPGFAVLPAGYSSVDVTVTSPEITIYDRSVGSGLQRNNTGYLGASNHGGVDVVLTSSDPTVMLVSPDDTTAGSESITVTVPDGSTSFNYYLQGLEGVVDTATLTATATGFAADSSTVSVLQPAVQLYGLNTSMTTLDYDDPFQVRIGIPDANQNYLSEHQYVRAGGPATYTATVTSGAPTVAQLTTTALSDDTVTVDIAEGLYYSPTTVESGGVAFDPLTAGMTTVSATIPGFVTLPPGVGSIDVTVTAPDITVYETTVGSGLQYGRTLYLGAANHGGVDVTITSSNQSVLLVSPDANTPGSSEVTIPVPDGTTSVSYYLQGVESATGTVTITASAPGYVNGSAGIDVAQPALLIYSLGTSKTTGDSDDPFYVRIGVPDASQSYMSIYQGVRAGSPNMVTATITNSDAAVGQLVTTDSTAQTVAIDIPETASQTPTYVGGGGVAFGVLDVGTTTVTATVPGFVTLPSGYGSIVVTVNNP